MAAFVDVNDYDSPVSDSLQLEHGREILSAAARDPGH